MSDREWCPECSSSRDVEDQFIEDTGDSRRTVEEFSVTALSCGHTLTRKTQEYPSPLQQATLPRSASLPDPFMEEG